MMQNHPKAIFRKKCLSRLKKASKQNHYRRDKLITKELKQIIDRHRAKDIMLYIPLPMEVDVTPLLQSMRRQKRNVYVPFMEGESFRLVKYRYPLQKKRFGIKEPRYSTQYRKRVIDIAIVPMIGIDRTCRRIGFGKGMYDRFFEKEKQNIKKVIFVARIMCFSKEIITDHYDIKADCAISGP